MDALSSSTAATAAIAPACQRSMRASVASTIEAAECTRERAAPTVFIAGAQGDEHERREHEDVPLPPAQVPVPADDDGDQRLSQQKESDRHRQKDGTTALAVR